MADQPKSLASAAKPMSSASVFLAGRNVAVLVLRELLAAAPDDHCRINVRDRAGRPQCDVMARAIEGLRKAPPEVIRGFAAVLTDRAAYADADAEFFDDLTAEELGIESWSLPAH